MLLSKLVILETVDSTNNYIANLIKEDNIQHGTVIMSYYQESGRGQRGTTWQSEPHKNLAYSIYLRHQSTLFSNVQYLSYAISLAVKDFLKHYDIEAKIKWPNDLLVENKKIGGILIENQIASSSWSSSIIGIGINVNQIFTDEIGLTATSMTKLQCREFNLEELTLQLTECIGLRYRQFELGKFDTLKNEFHEAMWKKDEIVKAIIKDQVEYVKIIGTDANGMLLLEVNSVLTSFDLKEVKFILNN